MNPQFIPPRNHGEFNARLQVLGIAPLSSPAIRKMLDNEPRERINNALCHANGNPGCLKYLQNITAAHRDDPNTDLTTEETPRTGETVRQAEAYYIAALFLRQLQQKSPWLAATDILNTLRLTVAREAA